MNKVVHFEIPVIKVEESKAFYEAVFGWKTVGIPDMGYTMLHTGPTDEKGMSLEKGFINGGMMEKTPKIQNPVITIEVEDIEKTLEKVKAKGGKTIIGKMTVGEMGYAAYFTDTSGNMMGLWQNK